MRQMGGWATLLGGVLPAVFAILGGLEGRGAGTVRRIRRHLDLMNDLKDDADKTAMQGLITTEVANFASLQTKRASRKLNWMNVALSVFLAAVAGGAIAGFVLLIQAWGLWWLFLAVPVSFFLLMFVLAGFATIYNEPRPSN